MENPCIPIVENPHIAKKNAFLKLKNADDWGMVYGIVLPCFTHITQWKVYNDKKSCKTGLSWIIMDPRCSMVLEYLPTFTPKMAQFCR